MVVAVRHLRCLKDAFDMPAAPIFYLHNFGRYLDRWRKYAPTTEFETPPGGGILIPVAISTRVLLRNPPMCDHTKFQPNEHRPMTVPTAPFTNPDAQFCHNGPNADSETPKWWNRTSGR